MAFYHFDAYRSLGAYHESCPNQHYRRINTFQATSLNFPITSPEQFVHSPGCTSWEYPGFLEGSRGTTRLDGPLTETQSHQTKHRTLFLERSVFDLVDAHPYLALTDPKLLGWYLSLTAEDRNIILHEGGFHCFLQRHPALELTNHHVYVKDPDGTSSPVSPSMRSNSHKRALEARTGRSGYKQISHVHEEPCLKNVPHSRLALEMLHNNLKDNLKQQPNEVISQRKQLVPPQDVFDKTSSSTNSQKPINMLEQQVEVFKDPAGLENCSLDRELDQYLEENSVMQSQSANISANFAEVNPLQSDQSYDKECISEYCSFDSMESDDGDGSNQNPIHLVPEEGRGHLEPVRKKSTNNWCDQNDNFKNILEEDASILVCLDSKGTLGHQKHGHSGPASAYEEAAAADASEIIKPGGTRCTQENISVPTSCVSSCDAVVGADLVQRSSAFTQTEAETPEAADKNIITELHMSDMDFVVQQYIQMKEKIKRISSSGCSSGKGCDCAHRAQTSELHLLALQYILCRQHCWRLYYTSAEGLVSMHGDPTEHWSMTPPANMSGVLQKLEADYNEMKDQIMKGVPLDQLKPLSINTEKINTGATYTPAQMTADVLRNHRSLDPHKDDIPDKDNRCSSNQRIPLCRELQTQRNVSEEGLQDRVSNKDSYKPVDKKTGPACKELNASEAWFDAKEDLDQPEPAKAKPHSTDHNNDGNDETEESSKEETQCSVLCVTNLPDHVTERDVTLWFRKYRASEVKISVLGSGLRVALVFIPNVQNAEAASKELNAFNAKGHTLNVKNISVSNDGNHWPNHQKSNGPKLTKTEPGTTDKESDSALSESSNVTYRGVANTPTAKATFVPQHFGTMGSFDTLMSELRKLHPSVKREKIVEALIELRAEHRGRLIGLPLRKIREMTSELLTRSEIDTKA